MANSNVNTSPKILTMPRIGEKMSNPPYNFKAQLMIGKTNPKGKGK